MVILFHFCFWQLTHNFSRYKILSTCIYTKLPVIKSQTPSFRSLSTSYNCKTFQRSGFQETISSLIYYKTNWQSWWWFCKSCVSQMEDQSLYGTISQAVFQSSKLVIRSRAAEQGEWTENFTMSFFTLFKWWCAFVFIAEFQDFIFCWTGVKPERLGLLRFHIC